MTLFVPTPREIFATSLDHHHSFVVHYANRGGDLGEEATEWSDDFIIVFFCFFFFISSLDLKRMNIQDTRDWTQRTSAQCTRP